MLENSAVSIDAQSSLNAYGVPMTTSAGGLEVAEFCQKAHSQQLAQKFVNLTEEVPFWTACSANEWLDKFNGMLQDSSNSTPRLSVPTAQHARAAEC